MIDLAAFATWFPPLADITVKATLILALAGMAAVALRRASAAARHLIWGSGLLAILLVPMLSILLPSWEVPGLASPVAAQAALASGATDPALYPVEAASAGNLVRGPDPVAPANRRGWLPGLIAMIALAGMAAGAVWLLAGWVAVGRRGRDLQILADPEWQRIAHLAARRIGLRRPVLLLRSRRRDMPATSGFLWPSVVIPPEADQWPTERREAVLAHELAHVKRFDCLTQALAQCACAFLWWHPGIWYAVRRMRIERERACDDCVLAAGSRPSDYATHLLEIAVAHRATGLGTTAMLAIAKPSQLESRLLWLLDENRARGVPTRRMLLLAWLGGLAVAAPVAAMQPVADAGEASERHDSTDGEGFEPAVDTPLVPGSMEEIIALRSAGVDPAYIASLRDAGYSQLSTAELLAMKESGVSAAYIGEMRRAGFDRLTPAELASLHAVGVTADHIVDLRQTFPDATARQIVRLRAVDITSDYVREMNMSRPHARAIDALVDLRAGSAQPKPASRR